MIEIREATPEDVKNVQRLWASGDVMKYVGFPEGLSETEESIREMILRTAANRPRSNYYAIYEDGVYCGETFYAIDSETKSASLDIKLFAFARGRGIATKALSFAMTEAFKNGAKTVWVDPNPENAKALALYERLGFEKKPMPAHVVAMGEDWEKYVYMENTYQNFKEIKTMEQITLRPITDENREAVLAMTVREDQPFVATNEVSLRQADEANAENPGVARPFAIYADEKLVGFCMFAFDPEDEDEEDRYWLWRFMIDQNEQGKGYGQAALQEIIRYFKKNGADRLYLSTEPENERGLHVYHKAGFRETGVIVGGEAVLMRMLKGPNKTIKDFGRIDVDGRLHIKGKKGYGVSIAITDDGGDIVTYCSGSGRNGQEFPVNPDMLFQAGSVSKPMFAITLLRFADKGKIDLDADISGVVPEFVKKGPMTFAALLSHTAGYNVHGFPGYPANHAPLSLEDVLNGKGNTPKLRRIKPYGMQHEYSGGGITLAELAFTRITGMTLRDAFQKEVAEPLGLKRTGFFQPLDEELLANAAFGGRLAYKEDAAHGYHYYPEHAAAGLWTTPTELVKIGLALSRSYRRGGFLKKKTARRMLTPVMENYGLCINNFRGDIGEHGGWNEGFITEWMFSLDKDLCVASMTNRSNDKIDWAQTYVALELFQNVEADMNEDMSKRGRKSFCGKYEQNVKDFRIDEVFMEDETLFARVIAEEGEKVYELYPIGKKTFGRKGGFAKIEFGDDCLVIDGITCRKL